MRLSRSIVVLTATTLIILTGLAQRADAQTTYTYTGGATYTTFVMAFTGAMRLTGSFTTATPIPPNTTVNATVVTSYSFNDGVQTLTNANTRLVVFSVTTDATGTPTQWNITAYGNIPAVVTTPINGFDTFNIPGMPKQWRDDGFINAPCTGDPPPMVVPVLMRELGS